LKRTSLEAARFVGKNSSFSRLPFHYDDNMGMYINIP